MHRVYCSSISRLITKSIAKETGVSIRELPVLSEDGLTSAPSGVYYAKGEWYKAALFNGTKLSRPEKVVSEIAIHDTQYGLFKYRGGAVVLSTDVNADAPSGSNQSFDEKLMLELTAIAQTLKNRVHKNKKLTALIQRWNAEDGGKEEQYGAFNSGRLFHGRYKNKGQVWDERSACVDVLGYPSELLLVLGAEIAKEFNQQTVLIKDYNLNKFYLVNSRKVGDDVTIA